MHVDARVRAAACGRRTARRIGARRAVVCNVTPTQLYGDAARRASRAGRALSLRPLGDADPLRALRAAAVGGRRAARQTAIVHLTPGLDGVSRAVNEAERGLLPAEATVVVGQPLTMDPSRAPDGQGPALDPAAGAAVAGQGRRGRRARRRRRHVDGRLCASATPTASRRASRGTSRTSSRRSSRARCSRRPTCRRRTSTSSTAIRTAARSRSTRTSSGGRSPHRHARRSTASGTSAPRRIPARASAAAPARSSRSSCSNRRCASGCRAVPLVARTRANRFERGSNQVRTSVREFRRGRVQFGHSRTTFERGSCVRIAPR